jgi:polyisoprenoid-binding protein YceI
MTSTITLAPTTLESLTGTWALDPVHSSLGFNVAHMVVTRFRGSFTDYSAELVSDGESARLTGSAKVASITTAEQKLYGHLQTPDFFDAEQHPELTFSSESLTIHGDEVTVAGEITMRGVTRPLELRGTITGPIDDAYGLRRLGLDLEGSVDRSEFGISWNSPLPGGGFAVSNTVNLVANLALVKQG